MKNKVIIIPQGCSHQKIKSNQEVLFHNKYRVILVPMPCGIASQMSRHCYWVTLPTYHKRLQATNTPPQKNTSPPQTCWGKIRETLSTKVRDVISYNPVATILCPMSSYPMLTVISSQIFVFVCSAFDWQQVPTRGSAWLLVQTQLHNQRLSSAPLPRTAVCMYLLYIINFTYISTGRAVEGYIHHRFTRHCLQDHICIRYKSLLLK